MLNFKNIEDLVSYMFKQVNREEDISIIANKELSVSIIQELLEYKNVILKYANVDDYEYDKEYIVTLHDDCDSDTWDIAIEPIYNYEKEMYFGTDGYILFHENVNSKAMLDMQNNENIELSGHDWFTIGEEEFEDITEDNTDETDSVKETELDDDNSEDEKDSDYSVTIKVELDTEKAKEMIRDMEKNFQREFYDMFDMMYKPYLYECRPKIEFFWQI